MMSILDGVHGTGLEGTEDGLVIDKRRVPDFYRSILLDINYLVVRRERESERGGVLEMRHATPRDVQTSHLEHRLPGLNRERVCTAGEKKEQRFRLDVLRLIPADQS